MKNRVGRPPVDCDAWPLPDGRAHAENESLSQPSVWLTFLNSRSYQGVNDVLK